MKQQKLTVSELLLLIPEKFFDLIAVKTNVDFQVKKLHGRLMFNLLLMGILESERLSLRVLEELFHTQKFQFFAGLSVGVETRHSSIRDRITTIQSEYFEELFYKIAGLLNRKFKRKDKGKYKVERFDSTVVSLSSKLMKIGMVSGNKNKKGEHSINQIKFTVGFNGLISHKVKVYTDQKYLSDDEPLFESITENKFDKNSIAVFDRGLKTRTQFKALNDKHKLFVTRINPTKNYTIIKIITTEKTETDSLIIEKELLVYLKGTKANKLIKTPLRLIIAQHKENNEPIYFITNIDDLTVEEITEVYKMRWDIEVFFRFLKQELNLNHLLSRTLNGIMVILYMTLITAMLMMVHKQINNIQGYKIAKLRFIEELDKELLKFIVIACNGNPEKLNNDNLNFMRFVQS